ncbi:hypothetical protein RJD28_12475 [Oscillospiraceae bacterium NTUH-002-81]|nr:hypothetical protein RJD28_12475 [Oscillospiraceae bacterium NTUH-002-81]
MEKKLAYRAKTPENETFFIYMRKITLTELAVDDILLLEIRVKQSELTEGMTK